MPTRYSTPSPPAQAADSTPERFSAASPYPTLAKVQSRDSVQDWIAQLALAGSAPTTHPWDNLGPGPWPEKTRSGLGPLPSSDGVNDTLDQPVTIVFGFAARPPPGETITSEYRPFCDDQTTQSRLSGARHTAAGAFCDGPSLIHEPGPTLTGATGLAAAWVIVMPASSMDEPATALVSLTPMSTCPALRPAIGKDSC